MNTNSLKSSLNKTYTVNNPKHLYSQNSSLYQNFTLETDNEYTSIPFLNKNFYTVNKNINFCGIKQPSRETLDYIRRESQRKWLVSLSQLDLDKISDICAGIPVFEGITAKELHVMTKKFEGIPLQINCPYQCVHCGCDSGSRIKSVKWDNFTELADGIKILKERLGFNPFFVANGDAIYPFHASDPMLYRSRGSDGKLYTVYNAAKYFYENTGIKFLITTVGWDNSISQEAAENLVKHPNYLYNFVVSLHPFHGYLERSRQFRDKGNLKEANRWKDKYVKMMCNVIKTTNELRENIDFKYRIILEYLPESLAELPGNRKITDYNKNAAIALKEEISEKLRSEGLRGIGSLETAEREIGFLGKAAKNFNPDEHIKEPDMSLVNPSDFPHLIYPDGRIMRNLTERAGDVRLNLLELPKRLNFKNPVVIKDEKPIPRLSTFF